VVGLQGMYLGKQSGGSPRPATNPIWSCRSYHGLELPPDSTGLVLDSHQRWRRWDKAVQGHQHDAALPSCTGEVFIMRPCRMSLCRSWQWAEARAGPCPQPVAPLLLPPPREGPWPRRCKGPACWGSGRPGTGRLPSGFGCVKCCSS